MLPLPFTSPRVHHKDIARVSKTRAHGWPDRWRKRLVFRRVCICRRCRCRDLLQTDCPSCRKPDPQGGSPRQRCVRLRGGARQAATQGCLSYARDGVPRQDLKPYQSGGSNFSCTQAPQPVLLSRLYRFLFHRYRNSVYGLKVGKMSSVLYATDWLTGSARTRAQRRLHRETLL